MTEYVKKKRFLFPTETISGMMRALDLIFGIKDRNIAETLVRYELGEDIRERGGSILNVDTRFLEKITGTRRGTFMFREGFN